MGIYVDEDATPYLIVTGRDNLVRVQQLSADGRRGEGPASAPFGQKGEAPVLFRRGSRLYAIFGHNCWCCSEGAEAFVWVASHPLGPWVGGEDINDCPDEALAVVQPERKLFRSTQGSGPRLQDLTVAAQSSLGSTADPREKRGLASETCKDAQCSA